MGESTSSGYRRSPDGTPIIMSADQKKAHNIIQYTARRHINMEIDITVYSDSRIPHNFESMKEGYLSLKQKYPLINELDYYTAIEARNETEKWFVLLEKYANLWIESPSERKMVLKKLKKIKSKSVYVEVIGQTIKI